MGKLLKSLLIIILTLVIIVVLAVGGIWAFCYFKYNVNVFQVASTLNRLHDTPEISEIAPEQPVESDYETLVNNMNDFLNGQVITKNEDGSYNVDYTKAHANLLEDLDLSGKETCALLNILLSSTNPTMDFGGKTIKLSDYNFNILQISFKDFEKVEKDGKTILRNSFNAVSSVNLTSLKEKMGGFPISLLKSKVPDTLYVSTTVTISMEENQLSYTTESKALSLNKLQISDLEQVFKLLNNFISVGTVDEFNNKLGKTFVDAILGDEQHKGFAYSLHTTKATSLIVCSDGFYFFQSGDQTKLKIKKGTIVI